MNHFASLIDRLATHLDPDQQRRLLMDYIATTPYPDRAHAVAILTSTLKARRVKLTLVRGLAEERLDPVLFAMSRAYVGDVAEAIALLWPARRGANKDPSLGEIVEALSTLGKSELPKRIAQWLDASDANGRWAVIKLITGTLRAPVPAKRVREAVAAVAGVNAGEVAIAVPRLIQDELFRPKPMRAKTRGPQKIDAVLMYVGRANTRSRSSPTTCTFGVWSGDMLVPVGKADLAHDAPDAERVAAFVAENTLARFGPVREVTRDRDKGLVLTVVFDGVERAARRKAGVTLRSPRIAKWCWKKPSHKAATLAALERLAPPK